MVNFNFFKDHRTSPVPYSDLGRFLGLSDAEINHYDIIAFEGNGNRTKGWESSIWFRDRQFASCFHLTLPASYPEFASWILRDPAPDAFGVIRR